MTIIEQILIFGSLLFLLLSLILIISETLQGRESGGGRSSGRSSRSSRSSRGGGYSFGGGKKPKAQKFKAPKYKAPKQRSARADAKEMKQIAKLAAKAEKQRLKLAKAGASAEEIAAVSLKYNIAERAAQASTPDVSTNRLDIANERISQSAGLSRKEKKALEKQIRQSEKELYQKQAQAAQFSHGSRNKMRNSFGSTHRKIEIESSYLNAMDRKKNKYRDYQPPKIKKSRTPRAKFVMPKFPKFSSNKPKKIAKMRGTAPSRAYGRQLMHGSKNKGHKTTVKVIK